VTADRGHADPNAEHSKCLRLQNAAVQLQAVDLKARDSAPVVGLKGSEL